MSDQEWLSKGRAASEHLKGFSVVELPGEKALATQVEWLKRFGPVKVEHFATIGYALEFLFPVKSFTTRYLIIEIGTWTAIITDMREANCYVDAYAISRATQCRAFGITFRNEDREFHIFESGSHVRQVESSLDGDRWHYLERGPLQPFENFSETSRRRKRDRLSVDAVCQYFNAYTEMQLPNWKTLPTDQIWGIERSLKDLRVAVGQFATIRDV